MRGFRVTRGKEGWVGRRPAHSKTPDMEPQMLRQQTPPPWQIQSPLACNLDPAKEEGDGIGSLSANIGQSLTLCTLKKEEEEDEEVEDEVVVEE